MEITSTPKMSPFASLKVVEFRNLMLGRFLFIMGLRMMGLSGLVDL